MDLPYSEEIAFTMGQVPCEFQVDWPWFIFQGKIEGSSGCDLDVKAAPDVIWHIYSGQCCFKGEGSIHLLSSRHTSPPPGTGPL